MNIDTLIFGYTDRDNRDEIVLCALCGGQFFKASPNEWRILRTVDSVRYPNGRDCDQCGAQVYFASAPDCPHEHVEPEGEHSPKFMRCVDCGNRLPNYEPHRLEVYAKFLETLDF